MAKKDTTIITNAFTDSGDLDKLMVSKIFKKGNQPTRHSILTDKERKLLAEFEEAIANGNGDYRIIGGSLLTIRARKLYRESHASFDEYCQDKFGYKIIHDIKTNLKKSVQFGNNGGPNLIINPWRPVNIKDRLECWLYQAVKWGWKV